MKVFINIVVLLVFWIPATLSYDTVYAWSLQVIRFFSGNEIQFYGKLWDFAGKPSFGFLLLTMPVSALAGARYFKISGFAQFSLYSLIYIFFIGIFYFVSCYLYLQYLLRQIEVRNIVLNNGSMHLHNVNIYLIAGCTIVLAGICQYLCYTCFGKKTKDMKYKQGLKNCE